MDLYVRAVLNVSTNLKHKVLFRADASAEIGYGHFIRTLALADMLKEEFDCVFCTAEPSPYQIREMQDICPYISLTEETKFQDFLAYLDGSEIVVLDNYFYTTDYQRQIKAKGCRLVCVDDMHDKHYVADAVVNHGLTNKNFFDVESYTKLCLGFDYALLRKPFLHAVGGKKEKGKWLISFGGSDIDNLTVKFASILENCYQVKNMTIVIGDGFKHIDSLKGLSKVAVKRNLTAFQMCDEMKKAEYAVLPSSSVSIEALACGCKIACGYYVDNQKDYFNRMSKDGYIYPLGNLVQWHDDTFVTSILDFNFTPVVDFSKVPGNYINLFHSL